MPVIIQCPHCDRKLKVPESLHGKTVRCPTCAATFTAATGEPSAPAPSEELPQREETSAPEDASAEEQAPVRRRRRAPAPESRRRADFDESSGYEEELAEREEEERSGDFGGVDAWARVRTGVTLVLVALCVNIGLIVIGGCAGGILGGMNAQQMQAQRQIGGAAPQPNPFAPPPGTALVQNVVQVLTLGGVLVEVIGLYFCRSVPKRSRARNLAEWSFYLAVGAFALSGLSVIVGLFQGRIQLVQGNPFALGNAGGIALALGIPTGIMNIAHNFTWLFFIRKVASHLKARAIAQSARTLLILYTVFIALAVVLVTVAAFTLGFFFVQMIQGGQGAPPPNAGAVGGGFLLILALACPLVIVGLVYVVWYIVLLVQTRGLLTEYLAEA